ncbi:hypothetical protein LZ31DRAFT_77102 [Colletotrichum somersetense]|nr:hypothetical protein LZ31DRAFT_77102 [Colletotrichum somersetense]
MVGGDGKSSIDRKSLTFISEKCNHRESLVLNPPPPLPPPPTRTVTRQPSRKLNVERRKSMCQPSSPTARYEKLPTNRGNDRSILGGAREAARLTRRIRSQQPKAETLAGLQSVVKPLPRGSLDLPFVLNDCFLFFCFLSLSSFGARASGLAGKHMRVIKGTIGTQGLFFFFLRMLPYAFESRGRSLRNLGVNGMRGRTDWGWGRISSFCSTLCNTRRSLRPSLSPVAGPANIIFVANPGDAQVQPRSTSRRPPSTVGKGSRLCAMTARMLPNPEEQGASIRRTFRCG